MCSPNVKASFILSFCGWEFTCSAAFNKGVEELIQSPFRKCFLLNLSSYHLNKNRRAGKILGGRVLLNSRICKRIAIIFENETSNIILRSNEERLFIIKCNDRSLCPYWDYKDFNHLGKGEWDLPESDYHEGKVSTKWPFSKASILLLQNISHPTDSKGSFQLRNTMLLWRLAIY